MLTVPFSQMQQDYLHKAIHRWNVKIGATGSGKTYLDYSVVIPKRIMRCTGSGLIMMIGYTKNTIEKNVLSPMRAIWSDQLVGEIRTTDNSVQLFGKKCYISGADKINRVDGIRGATIEYAYGDEITTWSQDIFEMLKSRLRTPTSVFDGTCNPSYPTHWFKKFLESDVDIYQQSYTIDDNPFLPPDFVEALKKEYAGTVFYDRYIRGKWTAAEGVIYRQFADNPAAYTVTLTPDYLCDVAFISIGVDFGGNKSKTKFVATGIHIGWSKITALCEWEVTGEKGTIDADRLNTEFIGFLQRIQIRFPKIPVMYVWADNAEQVLITGLAFAVWRNFGNSITVADSLKEPIKDRITTANTLMNTRRMFISDECRMLADGLSEALWSDKEPDTRLDDFTSDIDILDAFEYSWEKFIPEFTQR